MDERKYVSRIKLPDGKILQLRNSIWKVLTEETNQDEIIEILNISDESIEPGSFLFIEPKFSWVKTKVNSDSETVTYTENYCKYTLWSWSSDGWKIVSGAIEITKQDYEILGEDVDHRITYYITDGELEEITGDDSKHVELLQSEYDYLEKNNLIEEDVIYFIKDSNLSPISPGSSDAVDQVITQIEYNALSEEEKTFQHYFIISETNI